MDRPWSDADPLPRRSAGARLDRDVDPPQLVSPDAVRHAVNETGQALWELCDGRTTVAEMVDALAMLYAEDEKLIREDVEHHLCALESLGLLERRARAG
jgi:Coenzyme PQQ synthesis protein D (PqqD)